MTSFSQTTDGEQHSTAIPACSTYSWCTQAGQHDDHFGETVTVPSAKADEADYVDALLIHLWGAPKPCIVIGAADLNADQARAEAAKLRAFAAQVEAMASQVDEAEGKTPQVTFGPPPDGELARCHRGPDGVLHVTVDRAQLLATKASN